MTDLKERMQKLDDLQPPDLWPAIQARSIRPQSLTKKILSSLRLMPAMQVAALAVGLTMIIGAGFVVANLGMQSIETAGDPGEEKEGKVSTDESAGDLQKSEEVPIGSIRSPRPAASPGTTGSSTDSESFESPPPVTNEAGPPVFYTDQANDAYGPDASPNPALSQAEFDILRVDWGPVSYVDEQNPGGYSTSITIAGAARADAWYISYGNRPYCTLYHILAPGTTAYATSMCSSGEAGRVPGSRVTSTPTAGGGTILSATFDNRAMPPPFQGASGSGRTLRNLSAMTCMQRTGTFDCSPYDVLDRASSTQTYRF